MWKKLICLVSFVLVLGMVSNANAYDYKFRDGGADHLWTNPDNWADAGNLPPGPPNSSSDGAGSDRDGTKLEITDGMTALCKGFMLGMYGAINEAEISGGTLTCTWLGVGRVNQNGGNGYLKVTGGEISVSGSLMIPNQFNSAVDPNRIGVGHVDLFGGTLAAGNITIGNRQVGGGGGVGSMDITAGTLIINGNKLSKVQGYIDNGWITAYKDKKNRSQGTLHLDYDITNEGKTTLKATSALNPYPADGGNTTPGTVELSWTMPDPNVPGQPVQVDVYFTDDYAALYSFTDPAAIQVVSKQDVNSVVVQTQPKTKYYWAVDAYLGGDDPNNNPAFGPIFSFVADNVPPEVDAGSDVVTWLEAGARVGNLDATVIDIDAYTVQWTVVSEPDDPNNPDAVITDPTAEDTTITLSAAGEYVLQLEASDGEYTGSDTVTINVYNDSCEAAQSLPDYVPFPGDLNGDCKVDELDLAILEEDWLKDNSLTEEWFILE